MTANVTVLNQIQTIKLVDGINREGLTNDQWGVYKFNTEWNTAEEFDADEAYKRYNYRLPAGNYLTINCVDSDADWQLDLIFDAVKKNNIPYIKTSIEPNFSLIIFRLSTND